MSTTTVSTRRAATQARLADAAAAVFARKGKEDIITPQ